MKPSPRKRADSFRIQESSVPDDRLLEIIKTAVWNFDGYADVLESAIGALCWGRIVGWHGLRLTHSSRTFKRYEEVLGIKFRDVLPDRTAHSDRLKGIRMADDLGKFWQVISAGLVPVKEAKKSSVH